MQTWKVHRTVAMMSSAAAAAAAVATLAGCSSVKDTTCGDFAKKSFNDQSETTMDLIKAHDLDPTSNTWAAASVANDITNYCGITLGSDKATSNQDSSIDNGVDWSRYKK